MVWGILMAFALACVAYFVWARRMDRLIGESAEMEWERCGRRDPHLVEGLSRDEFERLYRACEYPRTPRFALLTFAALIVGTPVVLVVLSSIFAVTGIAEPIALADTITSVVVRDGEVRAVDDRPSDTALYYAQNLSGFGYFFGTLAGWLAIVFASAWRFHKTQPGIFRDELIRARAERQAGGSEGEQEAA